MPRQPRLEASNLVHHVLVRSVPEADVFRDDADRDGFVERLEGVVSEAGASLYAWALGPDQIHLLFRPHERPLSGMMRRLLTSHAVRFNLRHGRAGPLFRGRYQSRVVEEDPYLLEITRYIHLSPVRAGLLHNLGELDRYPYTGHSSLVGQLSRPWQDTAGVSALFSSDPDQAVRLYRYFMAAGFAQGIRPDLEARTGHRGRPGRGGGEKQDPRVLGGADFEREVQAMCGQSPSVETRKVEDVLREVCETSGVTSAELLGPGRNRRVARIRRKFLLQAVEESGTSCTALGRLCGRSHVAVLRAVEKARQERERQQ